MYAEHDVDLSSLSHYVNPKPTN